ncbi:MAG: DUF1214 domain-containing protein [Myxococcota bacterium]
MSEAEKSLRAAWDDLMGSLARARDAIDQPERMPAPPTDRNLAEGYRYLMGFVHGAVERAFHEDPRFPVFRNALSVVNKATIENADAVYFMAPIDGHQSYVVRGHAGAVPPHYLIFELSDGCIAGDSGSLAELRPGVKAQTGRLDSTDLIVDADGSFEILLAPERPAGHTGNFIPTWRRASRPNPDDPEGSLDRYACWVSGRQLFYDWEHEEPVHLSITQQGAEGAHPEPLSPEAAAAALRRLGALVEGQMHFWNEFYTVLLEVYGKRDGSEGERFMPRNAFNAVNAASGATGGGQSTNLYAGGIFELETDEALIVENEIPVQPQYSGFHLANLWGESIDYANHHSSLNGFQVETDPDGVRRYVVAHRDPGVPNWLDTTGHREGFLTPRWAYTETPPKESWPRISARKVRFDRVRAELPAGTRTVSPEERTERIRVRQEHVKRRFRVF